MSWRGPVTSGMVLGMKRAKRGLSLVGLMLASGCGSTVVLSSEDPEPDAPSPQCVEPPTVAPAEVVLRIDEAATSIDGRLHLTGSVDGEPGYYAARFEAGALWFDGEPLAIDGPARWVSVAGRWGRLRGGAGEAPLAIEALEGDTASAVVLDGAVPEAYRGTYAAFEEGLVFCRQAAGSESAELVASSFDGELGPAPGNACQPFVHASTATWPLFVGWTLGTGFDSGFTEVTNLALGGATVVSFGFAPNGVHQYGGINGVATDGSVTVVSTDNDDWMLAFDAEGKVSLEGPYVFFAPAGPKRLLTVIDRWAYFATPESVVAYDLSDLAVPSLVEDRADADWDPTTLAFLDVSGETLFVRDGDGRLWSVPRDLKAAATPTKTYAGEPLDPPSPCD